MSFFEENLVRPMRALVRELEAKLETLETAERQLLANLKAALHAWDNPSQSSPPGDVL